MRIKNPDKQKGAVLILMFTAMIITATTFILSAINNRSPQVQDRINKQIEMVKIKEQLLGYALNYADYNTVDRGPGRLPCPDTNNDANGQMDCSGRTLGRLPRSINPAGAGPTPLSDRYANLDQQFWYAVSPGFRENVGVLNSNVTNFLTLDGANGFAALIISPGLALDSQARPGGNQISAYLETATADTATVFISEHATDSTLFNDSIITITGEEVMTYATLRAAQEFKRLMLTHLAVPLNILPVDLTALQLILTTLGAPIWFFNDNWSSAIESYTPTSLTDTTLKFYNCDVIYTINFTNDTLARAPLSC